MKHKDSFMQWAGRATAAMACATWVLAAGEPVVSTPSVTGSAEAQLIAPEQVKTPDTHQALTKGLDWLQKMQKENGSWSEENYPGLTALGLMAFNRSEHPDKAVVCEKAAKFIAGFAQPDGGIYKPATGGRGSGGLSTYNTAICMIALHQYDREKFAPILLSARQFVSDSQLIGDSPDSRGFGYDQKPPAPPPEVANRPPRPARPDLSNTAWALQAMRETQDLEDLRPGGPKVDLDWAAALKFVESLQSKDETEKDNVGGFGYTGGGERGGMMASRDGSMKLRSYGSMTYAGVESMIYAQVTLADPRVQSALAWAAEHWSVDENPGMGAKGLFYYYTIMAKTLSLLQDQALKMADGREIPWKTQLAEKLAKTQQADGSWVNSDGQFWESDPALVTIYSTLALGYALGK